MFHTVLQAKLLRVLEAREFQRIGGTKTIAIDIRVLTATHRNLADTAKKSDFYCLR
ncbi:sigma-54 factor interaction domain-containing protein [Candidatus Poribacteria bacterium]|nr:sigma-54 factor interaction domain-containing protein [Candidatus Poribacteria bacterium]MYG08831.1 sigma-54 factor interaction domain-containing protein [Candidatus Poribacteria bacterium]MYK22933.1 sigma-54 factor interaction domain-containing protein [Candidatus Poribacteria bacterium]